MRGRWGDSSRQPPFPVKRRRQLSGNDWRQKWRTTGRLGKVMTVWECPRKDRAYLYANPAAIRQYDFFLASICSFVISPAQLILDTEMEDIYLDWPNTQDLQGKSRLQAKQRSWRCSCSCSQAGGSLAWIGKKSTKVWKNKKSPIVSDRVKNEEMQRATIPGVQEMGHQH